MQKQSNFETVPPSPEVMSFLYSQYVERGKPNGLSFAKYLRVIGFNPNRGFHHTKPGKLDWSTIPQKQINGQLDIIVLLLDFPDKPATRNPDEFRTMLFSDRTYPLGSMRDYFYEVSHGQVTVTGTVSQWIRMEKTYAYYTSGKSGLGDYPRNAQGMAEDAVNIALRNGVVFPASLDKLKDGTITALFLVHAGPGAEAQSDTNGQNNNIWSHKYEIPVPIKVNEEGTSAFTYLTVPEDARVGVCAHELGHLAFQWDDFYDPNYDEDGVGWNGSGYWDLMAGGSWNDGGHKPAHPAALHTSQHGWVDIIDVTSNQSILIPPFFPSTKSRVYRIKGKGYTPTQFLLLENRNRFGFDGALPGEGLLVWRVDTSRQMTKPDYPALLLLQADGRHDLESDAFGNSGDAGDCFPGSTNQRSLNDSGSVSTTFPKADGPSGVFLRNITRDSTTGAITLDVEVTQKEDTKRGVVKGSENVTVAIPDANTTGITRTIQIGQVGKVVSIDVEVQITHSWASDLVIDIISPGNTTVHLFNKAGGSSPYAPRIFKPTQFTGEPSNGNWTLKVKDTARSDVGSLKSWSISITYE
jgi:immune inhibitor A